MANKFTLRVPISDDVALAQTITDDGYLYEAKLYTRRVKQLTINVPVGDDREARHGKAKADRR